MEKIIIKIQVVLTEKMYVYRERSNSGPIFGSVPLTGVNNNDDDNKNFDEICRIFAT